MDRSARIAAVALAHAECSALANTPKYNDLLMRPGEDSPAARDYYYRNPALSTCALTVLGVWRLAGCTELEVTAPYYPGRVGKAFSDVIALAYRFNAWCQGLSNPPFGLRAGDAWVITDADGADGHMGLCVEDQATMYSPLVTVEGGQFDGKWSTAVKGPLTRQFVRDGNGWLMGNRHLLGIIRGFMLPIPDENPVSAGDPAA
jgi:hypothetical protein